MSIPNYLALSEQLCFPIYATSRMITRTYQPMLEKLDLTYPQYLVMLVLWEEKSMTVGQLGQRLYLNTNTLTPLLKKMLSKGLITKQRSETDERSVHIALTEKGTTLRNEAERIPSELVGTFHMSADELIQMRTLMWKFLAGFEQQA